jgi:hypothetical protein
MKREDTIGHHIMFMCGQLDFMRGSNDPKVALAATECWPEIRDLVLVRFREVWSLVSAEDQKARIALLKKFAGPMMPNVDDLLDIIDEKPMVDEGGN